MNSPSSSSSSPATINFVAPSKFDQIKAQMERVRPIRVSTTTTIHSSTASSSSSSRLSLTHHSSLSRPPPATMSSATIVVHSTESGQENDHGDKKKKKKGLFKRFFSGGKKNGKQNHDQGQGQGRSLNRSEATTRQQSQDDPQPQPSSIIISVGVGPPWRTNIHPSASSTDVHRLGSASSSSRSSSLLNEKGPSYTSKPSTNHSRRRRGHVDHNNGDETPIVDAEKSALSDLDHNAPGHSVETRGAGVGNGNGNGAGTGVGRGGSHAASPSSSSSSSSLSLPARVRPSSSSPNPIPSTTNTTPARQSQQQQQQDHWRAEWLGPSGAMHTMFRDQPSKFDCPHCGAIKVISEIQFVPGVMSYLVAFGLLFLTLGTLSYLPFRKQHEGTKDCIHWCPACGTPVARYMRATATFEWL
ncbi:hypothetical protein BGZ94_009252 [Podila epigama]|nr:hypothetical protein BGZ94_009252 [Podila epigama]